MYQVHTGTVTKNISGRGEFRAAPKIPQLLLQIFKTTFVKLHIDTYIIAKACTMWTDTLLSSTPHLQIIGSTTTQNRVNPVDFIC
jgi:hypothetical protein